MCIFTQPVVSVADTRIFARLTGPTTQLLVYEMSYAAAGDLAMVLPLPVGSRDEDTAVRFIDLSACPDFFDRLAELIWLWEENVSYGDTLSGASKPVKPPLKVHEVGAFDASFLPSLADFDRLYARFTLPEDVWAGLPQYQDYGFAVFKLRETGQSLKGVHPMAFEFSTRFTDKIFVPTVHVHDGQVHPNAWFDHIVYLQGQPHTLNGILFSTSDIRDQEYSWQRYYDLRMKPSHMEGPEPFYYRDGSKLPDVRLPDLHLDQGVRTGWKLTRFGEADKDRFGVVWPVGPRLLGLAGALGMFMQKSYGLERQEAMRLWKEVSTEDKHCHGLDREKVRIRVNEMTRRLGKPKPEVKAPIGEIVGDLAEMLSEDDLRFLELLRLLDPNKDLYAVGLSGLLPNTDTLIGVE
jgi:hypothetical protein